jgi:DNA-binding NarL/FixJ family response regulator
LASASSRGFALNWNSLPGATYRVLASSNLSPPVGVISAAPFWPAIPSRVGIGAAQGGSSQYYFEIASPFKAINAIEESKPDIALIDISLGDTNGIELLKNIKVRFPKLKLLVLSMHDESVYAYRALRAGASGYIMKQEGTEKVLLALRKVLQGEVYLSERLGNRLLHTLVDGRPSPTASPVESLSDRELEVFSSIGQGHGTRAIAEKLHLSIKTIETHRAHIKDKLKLQNATELVHHAIQWVQSERVTKDDTGEAH